MPECSNYYGDLEFGKEELVKAGVDPEVLGITNSARSQSCQRVANTFTEHVPFKDENDFANFCGAISMEYSPLSPDNLLGRVLSYLDGCDVSSHPVLHDHRVYQVLLERKVTKNCDDDLPAILLKEFLPLPLFSVRLSVNKLGPQAGIWKNTL